MKRLSLVVLLLALSHPMGAAVAADAPPRTVFTRWDPALKLVERSDSYEKGSMARWRGRITLTGRLVVEFDRVPDGELPPDVEPDRDGVAHFEPDALSLARLPTATRFYDLAPKVIWVGETGRAALVPLIGQAAFDRLQAARESWYEFPVSLTLTELVTSVECDHRDFTATVREVRLLKAPMVALNKPWSVTC